MRKLSYRAAVSQALEYSRNNDHVAAVTAWLAAADAAGRYDSGNRELCGREAVRAFNAAYIEPIAVSDLRSRVAAKIAAGLPIGEANREFEANLPGTSLEVFYWPGARTGGIDGKRGRTKGAAYMLCGTAMIGIDGVAGGIALSHVLVISEGSAVSAPIAALEKHLGTETLERLQQPEESSSMLARSTKRARSKKRYMDLHPNPAIGE